MKISFLLLFFLFAQQLFSKKNIWKKSDGSMIDIIVYYPMKGKWVNNENNHEEGTKKKPITSRRKKHRSITFCRS